MQVVEIAGGIPDWRLWYNPARTLPVIAAQSAAAD
jgi:hypothetical protein